MSNSLQVLINDVKKLLGLLNQVDGFAQGSGGSGGGNRLSGALATVSTIAPSATSKLQTATSLIGTGLTTAAGMAGGISSMMPDVASTIGRQGAYYGAGIQSGGRFSTSQLDRTMRLGLGQFQTSEGASARVAAMLTGRGMMPGSAIFTKTVNATANAARYLNMPNEVAASALENLTSGATSANMMRNFGVFTSNPATGQAMGQGQIFEQLAQRFLGGRTTTVERTMESLRRGNLGSNIRNSGLDGAQQAMLSQYMIDRARGVNMDLSSNTAIADAEQRNKDAGIENPFLNSYKVSSRQDELMSVATPEYLKGLEDSTAALMGLADIVEDTLIPSFGRLKSFIDTFSGNNMGAGALTVGASALGGGLAGAGILGRSGMGKGGGKGGFIGSMGKGGSIASIAATLGGGLLGGAVTGGAAQGSAQSKLGNAIGTGASWAGMGAMVGSVVPGLGTGLGALIGGGLGALYGAFTGGQESAYASNLSGGGSAVGNISPGASGAAWSGGFGEQRYYGAHQGIDIPLAEGTKVFAAADGKVSAAQSGSGERSYGLYVKIKHSDKYETLYAHLSRIDVTVGQQVTKGQPIGLSGNTGFSTGPHLHFGLYKNGSAVDPSGYISDDLTGGVEKYSAGNNGGKKKPGTSSTSGSILDLVVNPGASISSATSSILVTSSGVKGRSMTTSSVVAAGMSGGITGLSSPVLGSMGGSPSSNTRQGGAGGGLDVFLPTTFSSTSAYSREDSGMSLGTSSSNSRSGNNVTINVSIAKASEAEAKRLAKMVKEHLEEDKMLDRIGAR